MEREIIGGMISTGVVFAGLAVIFWAAKAIRSAVSRRDGSE